MRVFVAEVMQDHLGNLSDRVRCRLRRTRTHLSILIIRVFVLEGFCETRRAAFPSASIAVARMLRLYSPRDVCAAAREQQVILADSQHFQVFGIPAHILTLRRSLSLVVGLGRVPNWNTVVPLNTTSPYFLSLLMNKWPLSPSSPGLHPILEV